MDECEACGSEQSSVGRLVSTGTHLFVYRSFIDFKLPNGKKAWIYGAAFSNCGHLELRVNKNHLK